MKRILHVRCINGFGGGPDKTVINSPRYYPEFGFDGLLAFLHPPGDKGVDLLKQRCESANAKAVFFEDRGPSDFTVFSKVTQLAKDERVHLWQSHDDKSNVIGVYARRFHRMKLVTMGHGWGSDLGVHPWKSWFYKNCTRVSCRFYDACIAVSKDIYEMYRGWGIPEHRRFYVKNAIDTDFYAREYSTCEARKRFGVEPTGKFLFGALGRLAPEKGFEGLIRAVRVLRESGASIDLWIGGEGGLRKDLERQIKDMGLENSVKLLGHLEDPRLFLQCLDGFVLSSLAEGLPNVVLEALSEGVPVIATKVAGVPDVIQNLKSGFLTEIGDLEGLIDGMRVILESEDLRRKFAANGRSEMVSRFSFRERMRSVCDIYNALLNE
jgi:glycosyltransferase involved in cell wall biosynthesis